MCRSATFTSASSGEEERHTLLESLKAWQWGLSLLHSRKSGQRTMSGSGLTLMTCLAAARCFNSKVRELIRGSEPKCGKGMEIKHCTFQFRPSDQQRLQKDWKRKEIKQAIPKIEWKKQITISITKYWPQITRPVGNFLRWACCPVWSVKQVHTTHACMKYGKVWDKEGNFFLLQCSVCFQMHFQKGHWGIKGRESKITSKIWKICFSGRTETEGFFLNLTNRKAKGKLILSMSMARWWLITLFRRQGCGTTYLLLDNIRIPSFSSIQSPSFPHITPSVAWPNCVWGWKLDQQIDLGQEWSCKWKPELIWCLALNSCQPTEREQRCRKGSESRLSTKISISQYCCEGNCTLAT